MGKQSTLSRESAILPLIAELLHVAEIDGTLDFVVDGVAIQAKAHGRGARIACVMTEALDGNEAALRGIMRRYLAYADHGAEVLCADVAGRLMLVATMMPGDDVPTSIAEFCDAAVYWQRAVQTNHSPLPGPARVAAWDILADRLPPALIFP